MPESSAVLTRAVLGGATASSPVVIRSEPSHGWQPWYDNAMENCMRFLNSIQIRASFISLGFALALSVGIALAADITKASAQSIAFTNPTPADFDYFGGSVAAVGTNLILIGAYRDSSAGVSGSGAAYLFDLAGTLLTTITNPTPNADNERFGWSVAAVGTDRMLIGAPRAIEGSRLGAAYLYDSAANLLTTIANPVIGFQFDDFGFSVAAVGTNRVVVGAPARDAGGTRFTGAAYLFDLAGTRITTITNPTPGFDDSFGSSVAGVGADRVLIGARWDDTGGEDAGAAYLFDLAGNLLTTITNPTPASGSFGSSVAAVGVDRLLIGAGSLASAGAAYLFDLAGNLLTTFMNPAPPGPFGDRFGAAVAAVGSDRVLIGASGNDTGASSAGVAYLFDLAGNLLTTITNPAPANGEEFGVSVAGMGADAVLIGAWRDRVGAIEAGAAYVFSIGIDPTFSDENWISIGGIPGVNSTVYAAVVDGSGNLYVGGDLTLAGETTADRIAKWNGSSWSALGSGMNGRVRALVLSGNDLYAGGEFTMAGGNAANHVARWDGTNWATLGSGINGPVYALAASGNDLYAGGYFNTAGGVNAYVARWNDGSGWSTLGLGTGGVRFTLVNALVVSASGELYAGGDFSTMDGIGALGIAKWNGGAWSALGAGVSGRVFALAVSGSDLYAGGDFYQAGGVIATNTAKWNGSAWLALGSGMNDWVFALAVSGSDLYAGGSFREAGGVTANGIAKWNGSAWSPLGSGMNGGVEALAVSGSDLYAGGWFTTAGGKPSAYLAKAIIAETTNCNFAISPTDAFFSAAGGSIDVSVSGSNGCTWAASSPCLFVTVTPTNGIGPGVVTITVAENSIRRARSCTNIIAGREFVVRQVEGSGCIYSISPTSASFPAAGGSTNVDVGVNSGCSWTASSSCPFVTITPASGIGPGTVTVTVATNTGSPRGCPLTIARQTFTVTQAGAAGGLEVIATDQFATAPGHFRLVAPTNSINLQAIIRGSTSTPSFQWCKEGGNGNHDEVVFTSPTSSNTTVIFGFAGTYVLSVTASDGSSSARATVEVVVTLNPNGAFDVSSITNLLRGAGNNPNKFLTHGGLFGGIPNTNDERTAIAYYNAIDPGSNKMTFEAWKMSNDFPAGPIPASTNGSIVAASYFNALDLGFGRRMIMRNNSGASAFAVSNFTNVNDAVNGTGLIATVAMEYSPGTNGIPFTKFYVFNSNGVRVTSADLDGAGEKYVPGLCIVCHGGQNVNNLPPGSAYPNAGNVGAHFLPFDLRAFDYSCDPAFTKSAQQTKFRDLNRGVLEIERSIAAAAQTNARPAIIELIEGWYGGSNLPRETQDEDFIPSGWQDTNERAILKVEHQAYLYHNVVAPSCRSCHVTRPAMTNGSYAPVDFRRFDHFDFWRSINYILGDVFGTFNTNFLRTTPITMTNDAAIKMPQARRTFERFWSSVSPRPQAEILRDYMLGMLNGAPSPPMITGIRPLGTDVEISFTTMAGGSYRMEQMAALGPPVISTPLPGNVAGTGGTNRLIIQILRSPSERYFRVRSLP
jgi:hypothetical protein